MRSRTEIISELERLAREMGSTPGQRAFTNETGIRRHEWYGKHGWRNWGDLVAEAGLEENAPPPKLTREQLCGALFELAAEVGRFPSNADMDIKRAESSDFPARQTIVKHLGQTGPRALEVVRWAEDRDCDENVLSLFREASTVDSDNPVRISKTGWVYLFKQGRFHKLGATNNHARRMRELARQTAEDIKPEHEIETDDHFGLEKYWEQRWK